MTTSGDRQARGGPDQAAMALEPQCIAHRHKGGGKLEGKVACRGADLRRPARPEELSPAYVFLASAVWSSYLTGIVLPVTGSVGAS